MNNRPGDADFYAVLRVTPEADEEAIRQAYRRLAREFHPDKVGESGAETMKQINAAYRILSDPNRRREYDLQHGYAYKRTMAASPMSDAASRGTSSVRRNTPPSPPPPRQARPASPANSTGPLRLYRQLAGGESVIASMAFAQGDLMLGIGFSDGRIELWHLATNQCISSLDLRARMGDSTRPGVLQELRLSPNGAFAMAWGLNLGTNVWNARNGQSLWVSAVNGPSGAMDGVLIDNPPMIRLTLPAAPLALAETDPFHWAEVGRMGSDILTRPLLDTPGSVSPSWAVPMHCEEPTVPRVTPGSMSRIHLRALAHDGEALLTFASGPASPTISNASIFHWWNLRQHGRLGAAGPQRQGSIVIPGRVLWYPIAISANAALVATQFEERAMRIYNVHSGHHVEIFTGQVSADARIALSSDGALMALTMPEARRVDLWATNTGQRVQSWDISTSVTALAFATQGKIPALAIGRSDGVCEIWAMA